MDYEIAGDDLLVTVELDGLATAWVIGPIPVS